MMRRESSRHRRSDEYPLYDVKYIISPRFCLLLFSLPQLQEKHADHWSIYFNDNHVFPSCMHAQAFSAEWQRA